MGMFEVASVFVVCSVTAHLSLQVCTRAANSSHFSIDLSRSESSVHLPRDLDRLQNLKGSSLAHASPLHPVSWKSIYYLLLLFFFHNPADWQTALSWFTKGRALTASLRAISMIKNASSISWGHPSHQDRDCIWILIHDLSIEAKEQSFIVVPSWVAELFRKH